MQRDYDTPCGKCGHKESVYYMDDNIDQSQVLLMHICCNQSCLHYWKKRNEEDDEEDNEED